MTARGQQPQKPRVVLKREIPEPITVVSNWLQNFWRMYRGVILVSVIILIIVTASAYFIYRSHLEKNADAWFLLERAESVEQLRQMKQKYRGTKAEPFILYRLANALYGRNDFEEAENLYKEIAGMERPFLSERALLDLACLYEERRDFSREREVLSKLIARSTDPFWREEAKKRLRLLDSIQSEGGSPTGES